MAHPMTDAALRELSDAECDALAGETHVEHPALDNFYRELIRAGYRAGAARVGNVLAELVALQDEAEAHQGLVRTGVGREAGVDLFDRTHKAWDAARAIAAGGRAARVVGIPREILALVRNLREAVEWMRAGKAGSDAESANTRGAIVARINHAIRVLDAAREQPQQQNAETYTSGAAVPQAARTDAPGRLCISCLAPLLGRGGQTGYHCGLCNAAIGSM